MINMFLKKLSLIIILFLQLTAVNAQINIDSLQNVLKKEKTDSVAFTHYLNLMNNLSTSDIDASLLIGNWVSENALKTKSYMFYTVSQIDLAQVYHNSNDFVLRRKYQTSGTIRKVVFRQALHAR